MIVKELEQKAEALKTSKFNKGEQILFCVDYGFYLSQSIHSALFSTAAKALNFASRFCEKDYVEVYPVFDIWHNPKQVDCH